MRAPAITLAEVQVPFLIVGVFLGFLGSLYVQARQRRFQARSSLYLDRLPALEKKAARFFSVADQNPQRGPLYFLRDDDWVYIDEADALYRDSVLAGRAETVKAAEVRRRWKVMADRMNPEWGTPTQLVLGDEQFRAAANEALEAIRDYQAWLERRFRWDRKLRRTN
jgi:hypothetical protein